MRAFKLSGLLLALLIAMPAWARVPVPNATPEAIAYQRGLDWFWLADQAAGLLIPLSFLVTGWGSRLVPAPRRQALVLDRGTLGDRLYGAGDADPAAADLAAAGLWRPDQIPLIGEEFDPMTGVTP